MVSAASSETPNFHDDETSPIVSEFADDADMAELVQMFVDELPERMSGIEHALDQNDLSTATQLSHQIKGAAGGYGFPIITDAAADVEAATRDQGADAARTALDRLKRLCSRARAQ